MKIAVFLHGTIIMHSSALGKSREERVKQILEGDPSVLDYANYVPTENAVQKLKKWVGQGVEIIYLSSHEIENDIQKDKLVLSKFGFPEGKVLWRQNGDSYAQMVEKIMPDILIEDDCESIGGEVEMCYPQIKPELKAKIKEIMVKEFQGVDHLSDNLQKL